MADDGKKKNILVIDDSEAHLTITEVMLEEVFKVTLAQSGEAALEMLYNGFIPDLILLDIMMPEMDGWETYNQIRAISFLKDMPIVFVTSASGNEVKTRALRMGAVDFILKPLDREDIITRISSILKIPTTFGSTD